MVAVSNKALQTKMKQVREDIRDLQLKEDNAKNELKKVRANLKAAFNDMLVLIDEGNDPQMRFNLGDEADDEDDE